MEPIPNIIKGLGSIPGALLEESGDTEYNPNYPRTPIWEVGENDPSEEIYEIEDYPIRHQGDYGDVDYPRRPRSGFAELEPYIDVGDEEPNLDEKGLSEIETEISVKGFDVLGWYRSFHTGDPKWGVHVTVSGMVYLATKVFAHLSMPMDVKIRLGFHAICDHELFHFANDYAVAQAELALNEAWWTVAKPIHQAGHPGYSVIEERLANSYMLKAFNGRKWTPLNTSGKLPALRKFVSKQPVGYKQGTLFYGNQWDHEVRGLAEEYGKHSIKGALSSGLWSKPAGFDWPALYQIHPRIDSRYCPIYLVHDGRRLGVPSGWLSFFSCIPEIEEPETFKKYLRKLSPVLQNKWERTKDKLQTRIMPGADFKKWPKEGPNVWSVRVDEGYRAHLEHLKEQRQWNAVKIGTHREMGHG